MAPEYLNAPSGPKPPEPGTGTMHVAHYDEDDLWYASWQSGARWDSLQGGKEEVLAWALSRPAEHWEFHQTPDPFLRAYKNPPTSWEDA